MIAPVPAHRSLKLLQLTLAAVATAVVVQAAFGFAGVLRAAPAALSLLAAGGLVTFIVRGSSKATAAPLSEPWTAAEGAGALALAIALMSRTWRGLHRETFTYDVVSYHLHLPASWHALGRLTLIPTPFGDQAPAYAPANAELLYQLAIAASGNLRLAHAGQLPFAALAVLAIYATARGLGAGRGVGFGAALAFLLVPEVWQQATGAMSDLALASFVLAALPFLAALGPAGRRADAAALGAALGLALGTKYLGALMVAPLVVAAALPLLPVTARRPGGGTPLPAQVAGPAGTSVVGRVALVVGLTFACGGFWFLRNLISTGNPTFPVTLQLGPWSLAPGLYGAAEMRAWIYHWPVSDLHALLEIFSETTWAFLVSGIMSVLGCWRARAGRWLLLFCGFVGLAWLVVPYQQSRFFFCAWGTLAVVMVAGSQALGSRARGLLLIPAIAGSALEAATTERLLVALVATLGALLQATRSNRSMARSTTRSTTADALRRSGVTDRLERFLARSPAGLAARWATAACLVGGVGGAIGWARSHGALVPYSVGDDHDQAWAFLAGQGPGRRIAYAGTNLPLPLWGGSLENFVQYVNISGAPAARLHDFPLEPSDVSLSAEPAPERARPDLSAWLANLDAAHIDTLFVAALYPEVRPSMTHDPEAFPIERAWADALPRRFRLLFANPGVRIYRVHGRSEEGREPAAPASSQPPLPGLGDP